MFRFAHPDFLYALLLIPLLVVGYLLVQHRQRRNLRRFGQIDLLSGLMVDVSRHRPHLKFALMMLALLLIVFLLARPQYGTKQETVKHRGIEAIIAVDVSNSMLCRDVAPSRLDKSKMIVSKLIEQLDQDKVGLVAFAGSAITLLPVTSDNVSAKMFLSQLTPSTIALQGTCLAEAINRAVAGFSDKRGVGQALILITDAEDNEPGALEAVQAAKEKGIRCFVLGVGTESGGPIPMGNGTYKKDRNGQVVTTQLNPEVGKQIARAGDGIYIQVDQTNRAQQLLEKEIDTMQKADFKSTLYAEYDEQFIAVALLLLLVVLLEACIMEKRNPLLHRFVHNLLGGAGKAVVVGVCLFAAAAAHGQSTDRDYIRMGNRYFQRGQYHEAEICYQKAVDKRPSMEAYYNLANALTQQGLDSTAHQRYLDALKMPSSNKLKRANIYHNLGVIYYATGLKEKKFGGQNAMQAFQGAVEHFKSALRLDPTNDETRYDLAMAQWQLKNQENGGGGGGGQDDQNQDDQDQNQDQNQQGQDQQDQQDQQNDDQQDQQQNQQQQQQDKNQIDERTAEQLLNSAQQDEQEVQQKVQATPASKRALEKDW